MAWYNIKIPKSIVARGSDYVSYTAINNKSQAKSNISNAACYAGHMGSLPQHTFDCKPQGKSLLGQDDFFLWAKFCTAFGLSPHATVPYVKNDNNCLLINGDGDCKHRIYTGLCCYRWADSLAPLPYEACRLIELRPDINFYRILHWVTGKYVTLTGHSFTNVCAASMSMYGFSGKVTPRLDLAWAVVPKYFYEFGTNLCYKMKDGNNNTQTTMSTIVGKFGISLPVKKQDELFDDKWEELFQIEFDGDYKSTGQKLKACYDKLKKG